MTNRKIFLNSKFENLDYRVSKFEPLSGFREPEFSIPAGSYKGFSWRSYNRSDESDIYYDTVDAYKFIDMDNIVPYMEVNTYIPSDSPTEGTIEMVILGVKIK